VSRFALEKEILQQINDGIRIAKKGIERSDLPTLALVVVG
jgi:hypothetical protein